MLNSLRALTQPVAAILLAGLFAAAAAAPPTHHHPHAHDGDAGAPGVTRADAGVAWAAADAQLKEQFAGAYRAAAHTRPVFAKYLDTLGVPAMLDFLELEDPRCHGDAHELGKALYASNRDLGQSLTICGNGCTNACMHGVIGEAFGDREYDDVVAGMTAFCTGGEIARLHKPGNCAHGMGHALMLLTRHDLGKSLAGCARFTTPGMDYYCATGVFMEYRDELDNQLAAGKPVVRAGVHYPCDQYPQYPAACYRYMMSTISEAHDLAGEQLIELCMQLDGKRRLGCFHGLGAVYSRDVADDPRLLAPLCLRGGARDQLMCIEGVIEKLADFDEQRAVAVCETLDGNNRQVCLDGARDKMYRLDKATMSLYR